MQNRKRDTDVQNRILDSLGEGKGGMFRENSIETCILSRVKQITSPGWMRETSAPAWCTGKTQRNRVEREVGEGIGMGIHVTPWLIHVNVWQKPLQYCKVISLQLIKINGKKKVSEINPSSAKKKLFCEIEHKSIRRLEENSEPGQGGNYNHWNCLTFFSGYYCCWN